MSNYRDLCPDGDAEAFHIIAKALAATVKDMEPPRSSDGQGLKKAIDRELKSIRAALSGLSDETVNLIKDREIAENIERLMGEGRGYKSAFLGRENAGIVFGEESALDQLKALVAENFTGRKADNRRPAITISASSLWIKHGGKVTTTENQTGFVAFLELLIKDAELGFDPIGLIKKHLR